jgi:hypothetical protein
MTGMREQEVMYTYWSDINLTASTIRVSHKPDRGWMIGFFLATCSALLAFGGLLYAHAIGGFPFYDPRLMRLHRWGARLSLAGIVLGIIGCFRRNTLRWYAPICSVGVFIFWFGAAMGE